MDQIIIEANSKIQAVLEHLRQEVAGIRAGRANPALVENIPVEAYGAKIKLVEAGTISAPQPSLLTIQVWDQSLVDKVVKAIQEANLGLNPASDGQLIRLPIPPLTEERRREFIKLLHIKLEQTRVKLRQIRQEERQTWQNQKEKGEISEDEFFKREKLLQDLVDRTMEEIEEMGNKKEEDLTRV